MNVIPGCKLILAIKLLAVSSASFADQMQASADGSLYSELVWLLLIAVLGFSVVARRPAHHAEPVTKPAATPETNPEHVPQTATVHTFKPADTQQAPSIPQPLIAREH